MLNASPELSNVLHKSLKKGGQFFSNGLLMIVGADDQHVRSGHGLCCNYVTLTNRIHIT